MAESTLQRHIVNWRAVLLQARNANPEHGKAIEATKKSLIILLPQEIRAGTECRIYLDIPDPQNGQRVYVDFLAQIMTTSLAGQISQFRHIVQILDMKPEQRAFYCEVLKTLGH